MNVLFICTSNKDRSPALEDYFKNVYPQHRYRSAGINRYFTTKKGTHCLDEKDIEWADLIVYAESIHFTIANKNFPECIIGKKSIVLNVGDYKQGGVDEDYLIKSEQAIKTYDERFN